MRIACILRTGYFYGAENMTVLAAKHLSERHDVWYCSPTGSICDFLKLHGVNHVPIEKVSVKTLRHLKKTLQPDIFIVLDNKASMTAALSGVPFVSYQQNNWPFISGFNIYSLGMLFYSLRAKKVIGVSDHLIKSFRFSKYIRNKYVTIPNYVDLSNVKELAGEIPQEKTYDLCYLGRLDYQKRPWIFLKVVKNVLQTHPQTSVIMIGDGILKDEVDAQTKELELQDTIKFTGFIQNPFEYVKQSKLLIMTSEYEGHCLAVTEAMSLGLPVVASRVPGLEDDIDDSCGVLCDDENDYCKAITELLDNTELYTKKSAGAIEKANNYADINRFVSSIEKVCIEAIK